MAIALLSTALSESGSVVLEIFLIYVGTAMLFGARRWWKEMEATYQRQQQYIEKLTENALSYAGDLAEAERHHRTIYDGRLALAKGDFRMTKVSNHREVTRMESEVQRRIVEIQGLKDENAMLRQNNEALRQQVIKAASSPRAEESRKPLSE